MQFFNFFAINSSTHCQICSFKQMVSLIDEIRKVSDDDIVIYTGYNEDEIDKMLKAISEYDNIFVKFGRYRPGQKKHLDEVLGIELASDNQYARKLS